MAKSPIPWYRASHDAWYVWHNGQQIKLSKGKEQHGEACAAFARLLGVLPSSDAPPVVDLSLAEWVPKFLDAQTRLSASTRRVYGSLLATVVRRFERANTVTANTVEGWLSSKGWSTTTQRYALAVLNSFFRWLVAQGLVAHNPVATVRRPRGRSRGAEVLIVPDLHARLLQVVSAPFREFLTAVHATGARPGEIARVEAQHVRWDATCIVLVEHKTARKTGRERVIHLPGPTLELCRRLAAQYPTGVLFRNTVGNTWCNSGWKQALARAQRKLGLERRPMASGYRHGFATDALANGVSDAQVAELLGHTDTSMIHKHYGHLSERARTLKDALNKIRT